MLDMLQLLLQMQMEKLTGKTGSNPRVCACVRCRTDIGYNDEKPLLSNRFIFYLKKKKSTEVGHRPTLKDTDMMEIMRVIDHH